MDLWPRAAPRAGPRPQVSGRQGRTARAGPPSVQRAPRVFPRCLVPASWGVLRTRFSLWSALPSEPGIGGKSTPSRFVRGGVGTAARQRQFQSLRRPVPAARVTDGLATGSLQAFPRGCACVCAPHTGPSSGRRRRTGTDRGTPRDIRGPSEATPLESRAHVRHPRATVGGVSGTQPRRSLGGRCGLWAQGPPVRTAGRGRQRDVSGLLRAGPCASPHASRLRRAVGLEFVPVSPGTCAVAGR